MSDALIELEQRVSPVELFFDLVFGFAFAQVTTFWVDHRSWAGFGGAMVIGTTHGSPMLGLRGGRYPDR